MQRHLYAWRTKCKWPANSAHYPQESLELFEFLKFKIFLIRPSSGTYDILVMLYVESENLIIIGNVMYFEKFMYSTVPDFVYKHSTETRPIRVPTRVLRREGAWNCSVCDSMINKSHLQIPTTNLTRWTERTWLTGVEASLPNRTTIGTEILNNSVSSIKIIWLSRSIFVD